MQGMALPNSGWIVIALLLTAVVLETGRFSAHVSPVHNQEEHFVSREKRAAASAPIEYDVDVELNITDIELVLYLKSLLAGGAVTMGLSPIVNVTHINITTVCSPSSGGYQCRCEDQYRWPCDHCVTYGTCGNVTEDTCGCINTVPPDGQYCQPADQLNFLPCNVSTTSTPPTTPPVLYEYVISVELNTTDAAVIERLRSISYPVITDDIQVSDLNISTVCSPSSGGYQCRCEDQYRWPCDHCVTYGTCGNVTEDTCGCINTVPADGQYCQPADQLTPPVLYEYVISVELNTTDAAVIERLRSISYPVITDDIQVSDLNISTVCSPSSGGYQCRCEDQYRWPCDHCVTYGTCGNVTEDTCGCINTVPPDGQYCQPADQLNFLPCNVSTTSTPPTPPVLYEYVISIKLNITDAAVIERLRSISYPVITADVQVSDLNISTVCSPSSGGYQCRCEDQYRWPCDHCVTYGTCGNVTEDTCGCINTVPADGQYCQPADQLNSTVCSKTTTKPPTTTPIVNTTTPIVNTTTPIVNTTTPIVNTTTPIVNTTTPIVNTTTPIVNTTTPPMPTNSTPTATPTPTANVTTTPIVNTTTPIVNTTTPIVNTTTPVVNTTTPVVNTTTLVVNTTTPPMPTNSTPTATPTPTANVTNSTTAVTTISTTIATTSPTVSTTPIIPTSFDVIMSIELNKTYIKELADKSSPQYAELEEEIAVVLKREYRSISGFLNVSVIGFRNGSTIADFVVQTTDIIPEEVASANQNLTKEIDEVAPPIGPVMAVYTSPNRLGLLNPAYTGQSMEMKCNPNDVNVGKISKSTWTFNGNKIQDESQRYTISRSNVSSTLKIDNVISSDRGLYECDLTGGIIAFRQNTNVTTDEIRDAPNIQLQSQINVQCKEGGNIRLNCCVQSQYTIKWFEGSTELSFNKFTEGGENCITHDYPLESCSESSVTFTCKVDDPSSYEKKLVMNIFTKDADCEDGLFGVGLEGDVSTIRCDEGQEGFKNATCVSEEWRLSEDTCIITVILELFITSADLDETNVNAFADTLNMTVRNAQSEIVNSSATISAIVDIIGNIAGVGGNVTEDVIQDVLATVDIIIGDDSRESWAFLNADETGNSSSSSSLLESLEDLASRLVGDLDFETDRILLRRTRFNDTFMAVLNSNVSIDLPLTTPNNIFVTTITFPTLNNVMPVRNSVESPSNETAINAAVVIVQVNQTKAPIQNVSLSYKKLNNSLSEDPLCVFWNFSLFGNRGGWDDEGCKFVSDINNTVTCNCNHLTSFSILMSTNLPSKDLGKFLATITFVGVAISLASLIICLIIEGYVWKAITRNSTAFMRHVCIVNTALSLLIADICFIIGAFLAKNPLEKPGEGFEIPVGPCSTATFFMHFFYLALFFWMLVSGLLLFYRTVMVFSHMSRSIMMAIGFLLGYGCPLIIAVITVAVTAPGNGYIRKDNACWLNWFDTHALLALVIPALAIVAINIVIIVVVLVKMLRRGVGDAAQTDERHTLVVVLRCVLILTPLFGLTWSLGIGTLISTKKGIHIAFAFFNSLQGFFILVFGTLFDSKIRSILSRRSPTSITGSNNTTRSTSGGISSHSGLNWINRLRRRRYIYHVSETSNSNTGASESFTNI
ncbi:adhesion G protein-coupled receptor F5-like [Clinocottus analis]|uniref:adhesion G protein-coupled receptor F5-like n=1 Tax=Clinocottus analis TaxID=304258 RepID=UPI0035C076C2